MSGKKTIVFALAASTALHASCLFHKQVNTHAIRPIRNEISALTETYHDYQIRKDRVGLIEDARDSIRKGTFRLGEFIIRANALDAKEKGELPEVEKILEKYSAYQQKFAALTAAGVSPRKAISNVLGGVAYHGNHGGIMSDVLSENGGSCSQLSELITSIVYDSGYQENAYLRRYAKNKHGIAHMAPVFVEGKKEYDMLAGKKAKEKGIRIHAHGIVDAYARLHGLEPGIGFNSDVNAFDGTGFAYPSPPQGEVYSDGITPVFLSKYLADQVRPDGGDSAGLNSGVTRRAMEKYLNPGSISMPAGSHSIGLIEVRVAGSEMEGELEELSGLIDIAMRSTEEDGNSDKPWEMAVALGKLSGLYLEIEWRLAASGKYSLARTVRNERKKTIDKASEFLGRASINGGDVPMDPWELVYLGRKGEEKLFEQIEDKVAGSSMVQHRSLAMLIAKESSRKRTFMLVSELSLAQQAQILLDLEGTHLDGLGEFGNANRAHSQINKKAGKGIDFRRLQAIVREESFRYMLGGNWEIALTDFCSRQLMLDREHLAQGFVREFSEWSRRKNTAEGLGI